MVWAMISCLAAGPIITLHGRINSGDYVTILADHVHSMVQTLFPSGDRTFQDDKAPIHRSRTVQSWFEEQEDEVAHLPWHAQSPDLNIIEPLWSVLENRVPYRYLPPASLKELERLGLEEWYNIPLTTIQDLHASIPRRNQAV
ncbi:transposase, partial [Salmonella enterica subsp. enterica serovar Typhimurium]|nr:transposase [Salmonella enterica subsp. enterica serovar Typhimurium]